MEASAALFRQACSEQICELFSLAPKVEHARFRDDRGAGVINFRGQQLKATCPVPKNRLQLAAVAIPGSDYADDQGLLGHATEGLVHTLRRLAVGSRH